MIFDLSEIADGDYLGAGIHTVTITKSEYITPFGDKAPYIEVTFQELAGEKITVQRFYNTEKAAFMIKRLFLTAGFSENDQVNERDLVGRSLVLHLKKEVYDGKERTKTDRFEPCSDKSLINHVQQEMDFDAESEPF